MKRLTYLLIPGSVLLLCFCTSCFESESRRLKAYQSDRCNEASGGKQVLFSGVPWGSSRDQIVAVMGREPAFADEHVVVFEDHISGMPVNAIFYLFDNQLTRGDYVLSTNYPYENMYLDAFRDIEERLTIKYGDPAISDMVWNNNMFKYVQKDYGLAISLGHMSMLSGRKIGCVRFNHTLSGGNSQIVHEIQYHHIKMKSIEENARAGVPL